MVIGSKCLQIYALYLLSGTKLTSDVSAATWGLSAMGCAGELLYNIYYPSLCVSKLL